MQRKREKQVEAKDLHQVRSGETFVTDAVSAGTRSRVFEFDLRGGEILDRVRRQEPESVEANSIQSTSVATVRFRASEIYDA